MCRRIRRRGCAPVQGAATTRPSRTRITLRARSTSCSRSTGWSRWTGVSRGTAGSLRARSTGWPSLPGRSGWPFGPAWPRWPHRSRRSRRSYASFSRRDSHRPAITVPHVETFMGDIKPERMSCVILWRIGTNPQTDTIAATAATMGVQLVHDPTAVRYLDRPSVRKRIVLTSKTRAGERNVGGWVKRDFDVAPFATAGYADAGNDASDRAVCHYLIVSIIPTDPEHSPTLARDRTGTNTIRWWLDFPARTASQAYRS